MSTPLRRTAASVSSPPEVATPEGRTSVLAVDDSGCSRLERDLDMVRDDVQDVGNDDDDAEDKDDVAEDKEETAAIYEMITVATALYGRIADNKFTSQYLSAIDAFVRDAATFASPIGLQGRQEPRRGRGGTHEGAAQGCVQ